MYNEKYFLLTSMNLYEYSQKHNREMGVVFRTTDEESSGWNDYRQGKDDESIFQDAIAEIQSILTSSEFEKESFETKTIRFEMDIVKSKKDKFQETINQFLFTSKIPKLSEALQLLEIKPKLTERNNIGKRIIQKVQDFVEVFIEGVEG